MTTMSRRMKRLIKRIIIHHTASPFGDKRAIDYWHRRRGFRKVGYHYVILNGYRTPYDYTRGRYCETNVGRVEKGRLNSEVGAHCRGYNRDSIGIALVGNFEWQTPTSRQWTALIGLCATICRAYGLDPEEAIGLHRQYAATRCPGKNFPGANVLSRAVAHELTRRKYRSCSKRKISQGF